MKRLSGRAHGVLDYILGAVLIFAPKLFGVDWGGAAARIPLALGISALVYSLLTNYELGLWKVIPFRAHLTLDVLSGILLALSPWLFAFAGRVWVPHLIFGLFEIAVVWVTRTSTSEHSASTRAGPSIGKR